ncbi:MULTISPECIES: glycosyltransferase family 87 protein [unclassified Roseitalea]|uniref:glycosyltransferase family 87 protein n=1 Tax=unclassified Roseitalea TaxID=2639107 RepID=UPI00273DB8B5|nr:MULTISPECIES: glycosyltransferase family 87 protein [unclassified Roseitalea]
MGKTAADARAVMASGDWITRQRLVVYPLLMLTLIVATTGYVLASNGGLLPNGAPFGSDFVSYWVAARQALAGAPHLPYDRALFEPAQAAHFPQSGYFAFFYPPHYLAYMLPLGALPYYGALGLWMGVSFAAAASMLVAIAGHGRRTVILALAFPAAFLTLAHGQNAFLSAALFGGGLYLLPRRPVLAGILFGLLTFKPQLGLLIPLALVAAGQWRAIAAAGATLLALIAASLGLFGASTWLAFLAQSEHAMQTMQFGLVDWYKMISTYAALRVAGLGDGAAMTVHLAVALAVAATIVWAWLPRSGVTHQTRSALLLTGALLATPFGLNYDLYLLAPALAFVAARGLRAGFLPYEKTMMAVLFLAPMALLAMMAAGIAVMPILLIAWFALLARRAAAERGAPMLAQPAE